MMHHELNQLVSEAQSGNRAALQALVKNSQDRVYRLALRLLVNPDDALEATQEILIRVVTKLSTFRSESSFHTWVYRIAANYLLTARKVQQKDLGLNFELFEADLVDGLVVDTEQSPDEAVLLNELRVSCTMALLLCLSMKYRLAYVLGDILQLDHAEAAQVLDISKDVFRQQLSRARKEVADFTLSNCGIANQAARCSCPRRLPRALELGRVRREAQPMSQGGPDYSQVVERTQRLERELKVLQLQNATPDFRCPEDLGQRVQQLFEPQIN